MRQLKEEKVLTLSPHHVDPPRPPPPRSPRPVRPPLPPDGDAAPPDLTAGRDGFGWIDDPRRANPWRMAQKKRAIEAEIEVEGELYVWRVQRQPVWSSDAAGWRGMAIAVRHVEGVREAVVEFPPAPAPRKGTPLIQPAQLPEAPRRQGDPLRHRRRLGPPVPRQDRRDRGGRAGRVKGGLCVSRSGHEAIKRQSRLKASVICTPPESPSYAR